MNDLIYRQKAIEMLEKGIREYGDEYGISDAICDLDDMPSAEPNKEWEKTGEWEMFELITSVYYGKQYYFKQENEIVYSRASCKYMPIVDAVKEFLDVIGE